MTSSIHTQYVHTENNKNNNNDSAFVVILDFDPSERCIGFYKIMCFFFFFCYNYSVSNILSTGNLAPIIGAGGEGVFFFIVLLKKITIHRIVNNLNHQYFSNRGENPIRLTTAFAGCAVI